MVKVHVAFASQSAVVTGTGVPVLETFEVMDEMKPPTMPMWGLPLTDGDVVFLNMAMVQYIRVEKEKIVK